MFASLRLLIGWVINAFRSRQDLMLENLALRQQLLALHAQRPGRRLSDLAEVVLGDLAAALVGMEDSPGSCHTANGSAVASSGFSSLLEMALPRQAGRRAKTCEPRASGAHLSHGGGESDLGSSADPR